MQTHKTKSIRVGLVILLAFAATVVISLHTRSLRAQQQQVYTGNENHVITLDEAVRYIQNFKDRPTMLKIRGGYFGKNIFNKILSQPGCVGIRYYYAQKDSVTPTIILVGVDSTGNDMTQGVLAESPIPCPPWCPAPNAFYK